MPANGERRHVGPLVEYVFLAVAAVIINVQNGDFASRAQVVEWAAMAAD